MASNKKQIRKRIAGLKAQILIHHNKIQKEKKKANPNANLMAKWAKEIRTWLQEIRRLEKRLKN